MIEKAEQIKQIQLNIENYGYHLYLIVDGSCPRYSYTIGLKNEIGYELVFAGAEFFSGDDVKDIIKKLVDQLKSSDKGKRHSYHCDTLGNFELREVHCSWVKVMLLGAIDYFNQENIPALQIVPDEQHWTNDIPDLTKKRSTNSEPIWAWLDNEWEYQIPSTSKAVTNLDALKGEKITELMRWENDQWEMFAGAGPDIEKSDIRVVPISTLLALDKSLLPAINLAVGKGLWRDPIELVWHDWG